jgi:hypothetical protein
MMIPLFSIAGPAIRLRRKVAPAPFLVIPFREKNPVMLAEILAYLTGTRQAAGLSLTE